LLILTNDGDLTRQLTHPSSETKKVYIAVTETPITETELTALSNGIIIDGIKTAPAIFEYFDKKPDNKNKIIITIHEGKNRQIRKMFESIGVNVKTLQRIAEGQLHLGNLKIGDWRFIRKNEIV
jgi:23S rRNA pseudouridine2605 synthase